MCQNKRISLYYPEKQWLLIDYRATKTGRKSIHNYIISQISELEKIVSECNNCFDEQKVNERRVYQLPETSRVVLEKISEKIGLPPSTIVSRFIINPLLIEK